MGSARRKGLVSVVFVVALLASAKRTANPDDPPDAVTGAVIDVLDAPVVRFVVEALGTRHAP
ncbi:hypothetical protein [Actinokineospora globicatena]|uniref:Uncharacterized protein n=1 Tax=Actinokineospora globicatena TaxID=103729 RepID=A0A9W6V7K2_9PSEU|nr:hypothetical protein [Actinokineospora globicatena]GLW79434.1 hypothetical protein Aglo01_39160 [Actinokineospora globicatena]GLW90049.1 hypothetical protein Aglo03_08650 [Actinokineospora globicatena]